MNAKKPKSKQQMQIELHPDGWERFTRAVDAAIKSGPMHRETPKPKRLAGKRAKDN